MGSVHTKGINIDKEDSTEIDLQSVPVKVQRVHIDGIDRTKEDILIGSVCDVFSASDFKSFLYEVEKAHMKLGNLGCFNKVDVLLDTYEGLDAHDNGLQVTFKVRELKRLGGNANTNFGNNEGSVSAGASVRNTFGRGEVLTTQYTKGSNKSTSFNTSFRKPFHNETSTQFEASVYQDNSSSPWSGFKEIDKGVLLSLSFTPTQNVQQKLILDGIWRQLNCLSRTVPFAIREQSGHSLKSSLRHELSVDQRDHHIFPTDGVSFGIKNELAGLGGDIGFLKNQVDLQVNLPLNLLLFNDMVVQGTFKAGHMLPLRNNKTHCITDRFTLGGPTSIRGYEMAGIGPHSDGFSLGAEMFWAAGLHFYSPLPLLERGGAFSDKFRLHSFVNTGNIGDFVFTDNYKENMRTLVKDMRLSYGAGLAMNLGGMAKVELNYCIPLFYQRGDKKSTGLQFGISTDFL